MDRKREKYLMSASHRLRATAGTAAVTFVVVDVELVHNDNEGKDEGRVDAGLHQHVKNALLCQHVLQRCISYHLLDQTSDAAEKSNPKCSSRLSWQIYIEFFPSSTTWVVFNYHD